jgi:hypothetical protein
MRGVEVEGMVMADVDEEYGNEVSNPCPPPSTAHKAFSPELLGAVHPGFPVKRVLVSLRRVSG